MLSVSGRMSTKTGDRAAERKRRRRRRERERRHDHLVTGPDLGEQRRKLERRGARRCQQARSRLRCAPAAIHNTSGRTRPLPDSCRPSIASRMYPNSAPVANGRLNGIDEMEVAHCLEQPLPRAGSLSSWSTGRSIVPSKPPRLPPTGTRRPKNTGSIQPARGLTGMQSSWRSVRSPVTSRRACGFSTLDAPPATRPCALPVLTECTSWQLTTPSG